jgi:hypothetical protein
MEIRLKYLKPAEFQEQRVVILPRHPFFVRVSLLSVDTEVCLCQEFLFYLWTQKCVFFRVSLLSVDTEVCFVIDSLLSVDTEVCLCQSFFSVFGHTSARNIRFFSILPNTIIMSLKVIELKCINIPVCVSRM